MKAEARARELRTQAGRGNRAAALQWRPVTRDSLEDAHECCSLAGRRPSPNGHAGGHGQAQEASMPVRLPDTLALPRSLAEPASDSPADLATRHRDGHRQAQ